MEGLRAGQAPPFSFSAGSEAQPSQASWLLGASSPEGARLMEHSTLGFLLAGDAPLPAASRAGLSPT